MCAHLGAGGGVQPHASGYPQPMWASATMGGYWGAELKYAGYDGIIIQGRASAPAYLLLEDDHVSLEEVLN